MGRKQRLRRERRINNSKAKNDDDDDDNNNNNTKNAGGIKSTPSTTTLTMATATDTNEQDYDGGLDKIFPISDCFVRIRTSNNFNEFMDLLCQGAIEYGCMHSMNGMVRMVIEHDPHFSHSWLLEGAIRGSYGCLRSLIMDIYMKAEPLPVGALIAYWLKMNDKIYKWNNGTCSGKFIVNCFKDGVERSCVICGKEDSDTLTLQQCKGCSTYCYCCETCQTTHWEERNHRAECKQLNILEKYHKPYAKEIRDGAIRGDPDSENPALEKLRSKLGLNKSLEGDYEQELFHHGTVNGKRINPFEYIVGRNDGKVNLGTTPISIGQKRAALKTEQE
jgi:hypothetical protein